MLQMIEEVRASQQRRSSPQNPLYWTNRDVGDWIRDIQLVVRMYIHLSSIGTMSCLPVDHRMIWLCVTLSHMTWYSVWLQISIESFVDNGHCIKTICTNDDFYNHAV